MKYSILITSLVALFTTQCISPTSPQVVGDSGITYRESREIWRQLKEDHKETYQYAFTFESWAGFGNTTVISVEEGEVVGRKFEAWQQNLETGALDVVEAYVEAGGDIGSNEQGAEPVTLDELYQDCRDIYLTTSSIENALYFDTDEEGVLNLCGYVPNGCQDDCFQGITIEFLGWGIAD
ncbi:MAG TPA: hypothetical protein DCE41_34890 [Cytophagales bacterium]|nr:hypothetical protein [Cytophagales bacterium]HAA20256.1 hypothetical protein [Cytophagales bacterium]HAP61790.1 hypothetical protein [Cytophagales bacterium]